MINSIDGTIFRQRSKKSDVAKRSLCLLAIGLLATPTSQIAFARDEAVTMDVRTLTAAGAAAAIEVAKNEASSQRLRVSIAVVDVAGNLLTFRRMDHAIPATITASIQKAQTAAQLGQPSKVLQDMVDGGKPSMLAIDGLRPLQGGMPLIVDGIVVGGIGVSGASPEQDEGVARIAAAAIGDVPQ